MSRLRSSTVRHPGERRADRDRPRERRLAPSTPAAGGCFRQRPPGRISGPAASADGIKRLRCVAKLPSAATSTRPAAVSASRRLQQTAIFGKGRRCRTDRRGQLPAVQVSDSTSSKPGSTASRRRDPSCPAGTNAIMTRRPKCGLGAQAAGHHAAPIRPSRGDDRMIGREAVARREILGISATEKPEGSQRGCFCASTRQHGPRKESNTGHATSAHHNHSLHASHLNRPLMLASASPRRAELLTSAGFALRIQIGGR